MWRMMYIDFYTERNIPRMLSREGPQAATADVNRDGLEDVFIGGHRDIQGSYICRMRKENLSERSKILPAIFRF